MAPAHSGHRGPRSVRRLAPPLPAALLLHPGVETRHVDHPRARASRRRSVPLSSSAAFDPERERPAVDGHQFGGGAAPACRSAWRQNAGRRDGCRGFGGPPGSRCSTAASAAASIRLIITGVASTGTSPLPMLGAECSTPTRRSTDPVIPVLSAVRSRVMRCLAGRQLRATDFRGGISRQGDGWTCEQGFFGATLLGPDCWPAPSRASRLRREAPAPTRGEGRCGARIFVLRFEGTRQRACLELSRAPRCPHRKRCLGGHRIPLIIPHITPPGARDRRDSHRISAPRRAASAGRAAAPLPSWRGWRRRRRVRRRTAAGPPR